MSNLLDKASIILTPTAYNNGEALCVKPSDGTGDFDFSRATDATRINSLGLVETIGINLPRINYEGGCGSFLWEPQSTNLITQSELFSDASWVKSNTTIVSNVLTSPDGTINADNLKDTASNTIHRLRNGVTLLANTDYTISIFAKKGTLSNIQLALINTADSKIASRVFDLENGTLGEELTATGGTLQNSEIKDYGNGWYRCSITAQLTTTPNQSQITLAPLSSGNTQIANQVTYTGDGTGTVSIWGAMLEALSYPTSLIPTSGSTVTRNQDVCTNGGSLASINSTEGVLYAEIAALADDLSFRNICLNDASTNNRVVIRYKNTSNAVNFFLRSNNATIINTDISISNIKDFNKVHGLRRRALAARSRGSGRGEAQTGAARAEDETLVAGGFPPAPFSAEAALYL